MNSRFHGGVLPSQELQVLIGRGVITGAPAESVGILQPASIDLTLGSVGYRIQSSFLPQNGAVEERMSELVMYEVDLRSGGILEKGAVYLIPLMEQLSLPSYLMGKTNPKSSTGRLDVFTRVISDHAKRFEEITPGYHGGLYLEVVPRSFTIKVKTGQRLNQLRLYNVTPEESAPDQREIFESELVTRRRYVHGSDFRGLYRKEELLYDGNGHFIGDHHGHIGRDGLLMSVNLDSSLENGGVIGYKTKKNSQVLDLERVGEYDTDDFWETIHPPKNGRLILEPEEFYIFASKELIRIPLDYAAEMVEFDAGSGELRTHYAGFFDPGFGYGLNGEVKGTRAVLEVRPHDVPFIIESGQILFKMKYEPMRSKPEIYYGAEIGSNYHNQSLKLSKLFKTKG